MKLRRALPADLGDRLPDLIARVADEQRAPPFGEVLLAAMENPDGGGVGFAAEEEGLLLSYGFAAANPDGRVWTLEVADRSGQRDRLYGELVEHLDAMGIEETVLWLHAPGPGPPPELFRHDRDLYRMAAPLPVADTGDRPAGVAFSGLDIERDAQALITVNNRAFSGHPEQGEWSEADLRQRASLPWFDARGVRIARIDGRMVAFHWTKVHETPAPDGGALGEIYVLAVDPAFHGRGLGRAIALDGLRYLSRRRNATRAVLYVDSASTVAVNLYRSLGFSIEHTDRAYRRTRLD